jgi:hypothetical protein
MNRFLAAISMCAAALAASSAMAKTTTIENKFLVVAYDDDAKTFSVKEKATGKVFLKDGKLDRNAEEIATGREVTTGHVANHPNFGEGDFINVISYPSSKWLTLFKDVPFVFVHGVVGNYSKGPLDIQHVAPASFTLDLGKPAQELRTLGTAALTTPDKNPGSYLFLTLADPKTRRGVVAGWVTTDRGDGVLFSNVKNGQVEFKSQIDYGHLRIPAKHDATTYFGELETLAVGVFDDARLGQEQFADLIAKHYQIKLKPQVNGYCTWYADKHGGAGDEKSIVELAATASQILKPFGFSFVQIDDQWQDDKEYNGPRRGFDRVRPDGPYPHGMKPVADRFKELGLTAGVWFMPFARNHQSPEYKDRQDWFVKRQNGKPFETAWGGTSLDLTKPEVQEHLKKLIQTIHGWGYNYFKMDGLWTGTATEQIYVNDGYRDDHMGNNAPFCDPSKTNIEVFRGGLKLVREAAGPDVFFSGCNVSQNMRTLGAAMGLVDSMRIGPDNGQKWANYKEEIAHNGCGSIITGPIRGTRLYFLNGRVWWNDPDPSYVRASIPLKHARLITSWVALSGQFNLNSDWIPGLPAERLDVMKRTMPAHGATARPVDYFDSPMPSIWTVTDARQAVRRDVLGLFNWDDADRTIEFAADWAGLDPAKTYFAFDFWNKKPAGVFSDNKFKFDVPCQSCRVIAVRAAEGHPTLVSTSRHVTQGIVDVTGETWNADAKTLSGVSQVVAGDDYELRIAGLNDGGAWRLAGVEVSEADRAAGATIEAKPIAADGQDWTRVVITSKTSRPVQWKAVFQR